MGSRAVWQLALLLRQAAGRSLQVIAPPPALTSWVNDKVAFAQTVEQLFGAKALPPTTCAANFTSLAHRVRGMASSADTIVVKHPESAGGHGNFILEGRRIRGRALGAVRDLLRRALPDWKQDRPLLVSHWEEPVLQSPSLHVWVPPLPQGPPIVEGIFEQRLLQGTHSWRGAVAAQLPECTTQRMVDRCWLMAYLYQRLGYVGRCSFDILLVGTDPEQAAPHLLECNGRWGGASLPMTLMNRLFGDWATRDFAVGTITPPPGRYPTLTGLLDALDAWDVRTARGSVILSNPGCLAAGFGFEAITLGSDRAEAIDRAEREVPARVLPLLHRDEARRRDTSQRVAASA
jgi:hypothetical protein